MPHLISSNKDDAVIQLELDPAFTGVLRGVAHDVSEGCLVKGNCIVQVNKSIKVKKLVVWLEGRCKVTIKTNNYSVSSNDGTESRTVYTKDQQFIGSDGQTHVLAPGQYIYPFFFDLPPSLPASFRGKRGYIRYRLQAAIYRPMFNSDINVSRDIPIRRCLLHIDTPIVELRETYQGVHHTNKLYYTVTTPTITYREGGLVRLNLTMQLMKPETQSVKTVTCALRERVQYRTTDSQANTVLAKTENLFPLGYSTFYPSDSPDYDPKEKSDYNALFRLCPRVNADLNSRLMKVTHALVVNIMVEDTNPTDEDIINSESCCDTTESEWASEDDYQPSQDIKQPIGSTHNPPTLHKSTSASSLSSRFSLGKSQSDMISIPTIKTSRRNRNKHQRVGPKLILCSIEVPLAVTSRENSWKQKALPPAYEQSEKPPSYYSSVECLPKAPNYPHEEPISI